MARRIKENFQIQLKDNQKEVINFFRENQLNVLTGMAGTAKSTLALYYAISQLIAGEFEQVVLAKPLQVTGQEVGFLKGSLTEKLDPFVESYRQILIKLLGESSANNLLNGKKVVFLPLPYIRSMTIENSVLILDEAQNATLHTIMSFVTRMAESTKTILLGDKYQTDIKRSGLEQFINLGTGIIGYKHLDESFQMRSSLIVELQNRYIKYLNQS